MIKLLLPEKYLISRWSGGTTTQVAIAPENEIYQNRNFGWRVSSAEVQLDESDFTPLPDYHRYIAVLDGRMTLTHKSGEPIELLPGLIYSFDGGAATHSVGRCTDFNLMIRKNQWNGDMECLTLSAGEKQSLHPRYPQTQILLYCYSGKATVSEGAESLSIGERQSLLFQGDKTPLVIECQQDAMIMAAWMWT